MCAFNVGDPKIQTKNIKHCFNASHIFILSNGSIHLNEEDGFDSNRIKSIQIGPH